MTTTRVSLLVGLANLGEKYQGTRHNIGASLIRLIANEYQAHWQVKNKLKAAIAPALIAGSTVYLAIPQCYMNHSGTSVRLLMDYYRLPPQQVLIAHDELDLPCGSIRCKLGGGHGGHNGLRDIQRALGGVNTFTRIRIGIGRSHHKDVVNYVLSKPTVGEHKTIESGLHKVLDNMADIISGNWQQAMKNLHTEGEHGV